MTAVLLTLLLAQTPAVREEAARLKAEGQALLDDRTRSAQARGPLEKAVKLTPGDPEAHYYLARWACLHNEDRLCMGEARAALSLAPHNDDAALQLQTMIGIAAQNTNQPKAAEAAFVAALGANKRMGLKDPLAAFQYIDFLLKRARDSDALPIIQLLMDKVPAFGPAYLERAKLLARDGQRKEAVEMAEYCLKLRWMDREKQRAAHVLLARTYYQLGDEESARKHQEWVEQNR